MSTRASFAMQSQPTLSDRATGATSVRQGLEVTDALWQRQRQGRLTGNSGLSWEAIARESAESDSLSRKFVAMRNRSTTPVSSTRSPSTRSTTPLTRCPTPLTMRSGTPISARSTPGTARSTLTSSRSPDRRALGAAPPPVTAPLSDRRAERQRRLDEDRPYGNFDEPVPRSSTSLQEIWGLRTRLPAVPKQAWTPGVPGQFQRVGERRGQDEAEARSALEAFHRDRDHRDAWRKSSHEALERKCREQELEVKCLTAEADTLRSMTRELERRVAKSELEARVLSGRLRERCGSGFGTCVICLQDPVSHVIVPCGHLALCAECSQLSLKKCPMCNQGAEKVMKVFTPGLDA